MLWQLRINLVKPSAGSSPAIALVLERFVISSIKSMMTEAVDFGLRFI